MRESDPQSRWWWIESRSAARGSPWLQSILTELNEKTKTMLGLIEHDADSFGQRAEMYYRKRPELISMVEDFYRAHRSLAEQLDHVKSKSTLAKHVPTKITSSLDIENDSCYATYYPDEYKACYADENVESEVDDPEDQDEVLIGLKTKEEEFPVIVDTNEVLKSGEEVEKLRQGFSIEEENADSEIDDPDDQDEIQLYCPIKEEEFSVTVDTTNDEVLKSMPELERPIEVFAITAGNAKTDVDHHEGQDKFQLDYKIEEEEFPIMVDTNDEVLKLRAELKRSRAEFSITGENAESEISYPENQNEVLVDYKTIEIEFSTTVDTNDEVLNLRTELERLREENRINQDKTIEEEFPTTVDTSGEVLNLRTELERLREENRINQDKLNQKDEEKKEAIRHLSLAVDVLKQESERMRKFIATQSPKKPNLTQLSKLKGAFGKLFSSTPIPRCQPVGAL